jgi:hypothetical protein
MRRYVLEGVENLSKLTSTRKKIGETFDKGVATGLN